MRVLSTTAYGEASTCLQKYYYHHVARLTPKPSDTRPALRRGIWIHKAIADYYHGKPWGEAIDALVTWATDRGVPQEEADTIAAECRSILDGYFSYWATRGERWEVLTVEEPMFLQVSPSLTLRATVDAIVRNKHGVWLVEHKSTAEIPSATWRAVDPQTAIQYISCKARFPDLQGVIFDYILTKPAPVPQVKQDGKFYAREVTTTTLAFGRGVEEVSAKWRGSPVELAEYLVEMHGRMVADGQFYQRHIVIRPHEHIVSTMRDVAATNRAINEAEQTNHWRRSFSLFSCSRFCSYGSLCMTEYVSGKTAKAMREHEFVIDDETQREGR